MKRDFVIVKNETLTKKKEVIKDGKENHSYSFQGGP